MLSSISLAYTPFRKLYASKCGQQKLFKCAISTTICASNRFSHSVVRFRSSETKATPSGTARFFGAERTKDRLDKLNAIKSLSNPSVAYSRPPLIKPKVAKKTGWTVGPISLGTYRLKSNSTQHSLVIEEAFQSGAVNLIDTSPNYGQGAEALTGMALKRLIDSGAIERDEVIVVEKLGSISRETFTAVQQRISSGRGFPGLRLLAQDLAYCLDAEFINYQIGRMLNTLELDTIDLVMIDTPEILLPNGATSHHLEQLYQIIGKAFEALELEVKKGRIQYYGVSSSLSSVTKAQDQKIGLNQLLELAKHISPDNHFAAIQYPLNAMEPQAMYNDLPDKSTYLQTANWSRVGSDSSIQLVAYQAGLLQLGVRPLNSLISTDDIFVQNQPQSASTQMNGIMYRLADVPAFDGKYLSNTTKTIINSCLNLEQTYALEHKHWLSTQPSGGQTKVEPQYTSEQLEQMKAGMNVRPQMRDSLPLATKEMPDPRDFSWTQITLSNIARLDLETFKASIEKQYKPTIKSSLETLRRVRPDMELWAIQYEAEINQFMNNYEKVLSTNRQQELMSLQDKLNQTCTELSDNKTMASKAVRMALSTLVTSEIFGTTSVEHLHDVIYGSGSPSVPKPMTPLPSGKLNELFDICAAHKVEIRKTMKTQFELEEEAIKKQQSQPHNRAGSQDALKRQLHG